MPLHRYPHASAREDVEALEKAGEIVTAIASDDSGVYVATTKAPKAARKPTGEKETRA